MRWYHWIILALVALVIIDAVGRLLLSSKTRFDFVAGPANSRVLFVYFPGILADGVYSSQDLLPIWQARGDVLLVSYDGKRFDGDKIARETAAEVHHLMGHDPVSPRYSEVVFIGSSMGGLLSFDTYQKEDVQHLRGLIDFSFVLLDAPTRRSDLQPPQDKISLGSRMWTFGPITNLLSKPYFNLTFVKPKEENIESGVDRHELERRVKQAQSYPLSWAMDQTRYIIGHPPLRGNSLAGTTVVYVRSTRDTDTVREEAFYVWRAASGGMAERIQVDSTHVGFAERPLTWQQAFEQRILPAVLE